MIDLSDLRPWQRTYNEQHAFDAYHYLMAEARLGKTRAEVRCMEQRFAAGSRRVLVCAPQKPCELTWTVELAMRGIQHLDMHSGTLIERVERLHAHMASTASNYPTVITVNYEVLEQYPEPITKKKDDDGREWFHFRKKQYEHRHEADAARIRSNSGTVSDELTKWMPQDIIVDEAQLISSAGAQRTWALRRLGRLALCRRCLSGTPDPNGSVGFYAQFAFLAPHTFDGKGVDAKGQDVFFSGTRKADFLAQYAIMDPYGQQILAYRNENEMLAKVFAVSTRVRARDIYKDTPEDSNTTRAIPWPAPARKLYDKLKREHVLTTADDGIAIDGSHKLTRMLRGLQMCSGFLVDQDESKMRWVQKEKLNALISEVSEIVEADKMVVVAYSYTAAGEEIAAALAAKYGVDRVALVNGSTNERTANATLRLFDVGCTEETSLRILVLQEQVGGMGISLARAAYMVFYSWTMDYNVHEQMRKRIWNESRQSFYIYLEMQKSADGFAREIVKHKHLHSIMQNESFNLNDALDGQIAA